MSLQLTKKTFIVFVKKLELHCAVIFHECCAALESCVAIVINQLGSEGNLVGISMSLSALPSP